MESGRQWWRIVEDQLDIWSHNHLAKTGARRVKIFQNLSRKSRKKGVKIYSPSRLGREQNEEVIGEEDPNIN